MPEAITVSAKRNRENLELTVGLDGVITAPASLRNRTLVDLLRAGYTLSAGRPGVTSSGLASST